MKISYAVTVVNEINEIQKLLPILIENKVDTDEIVVQYDNQKVTVEVLEYLNDLVYDKKINKLIGYPLNGDFGTYKEHLNQNCEGDWVFQLDADELLAPELIKEIETKNGIVEVGDYTTGAKAILIDKGGKGFYNRTVKQTKDLERYDTYRTYKTNHIKNVKELYFNLSKLKTQLGFKDYDINNTE